MPDANFYRACVPRWWRERKPRFFNCGDRQDVLDSYSLLLELHREDSSKSYLNPEKLFAIVDLDLYKKPISDVPDCRFTDTDAIFRNLYDEGQVNESNAAQHRIWVTGLIHKEAYFIIPELQPIFDDFEPTPIYKGSPVLLDKIYLDMAESICEDKDLEHRLDAVSQRIGYCPDLDCTSRSKLQESCKNQFDRAEGRQRRNLIMALLSVRKAKPYWKKIKLSGDSNPSHHKVFRDEISLKIGDFYSRQKRDAKYHLSVFFKTLFKAR